MKREFSLGSKWLYYKIYVGVKTADIALVEKIDSIILKLEKQDIISKWFFIRYRDPEEHLRLRLLLKNPKDFTKTIQLFHSVFENMQQQHIIWKIQTDTYKREIERYGKETIKESESIFFYDSSMILQYLKLKPHFSIPEIELFFSFFTIDSFLNSFQLSHNDKLSLMDQLQKSFKEEFKADKILKKEMDKHYRMLFQDMNQFMNVRDKNDQLSKLIVEKEIQINKIAPIIKSKIQIPLFDFLKSHIHMTINRQYTSKQRNYELIIYDHLYRFYKTKDYNKP